eukprot:6179271-Pleurochrysis_carterae.AAC.5
MRRHGARTGSKGLGRLSRSRRVRGTRRSHRSFGMWQYLPKTVFGIGDACAAKRRIRVVTAWEPQCQGGMGQIGSVLRPWKRSPVQFHTRRRQASANAGGKGPMWSSHKKACGACRSECRHRQSAELRPPARVSKHHKRASQGTARLQVVGDHDARKVAATALSGAKMASSLASDECQEDVQAATRYV